VKVTERIHPAEHADISMRRVIVDLYELLAETQNVSEAMTLADQLTDYIRSLSHLQDLARTRADYLTNRRSA